jgi:hypothetical protein
MITDQRAFLRSRTIQRPVIPSATKQISAGNGIDVHVAFTVGAAVVLTVTPLVTVVVGGFVVGDIVVEILVVVAVFVGWEVGWSATKVIFFGPEIVTPSVSP